MIAGCALTVLHSVNRKHAAKRFSVNQKTGEIRNRSYGSETVFAVEVIELTSFADLAAALSRLTKQPHAFVIRGEPLPGINRKHCRRLLHPDKKRGEAPTFKAVPRRWFAVDMDHIDCPAAIHPVSDPQGAVEYLIGLLPPELHDGWCWWQFTSSQSLPGHTDTLSARLWYLLEEAVDDASLKRWSAAVNRAGAKLVDPALYSGVQAHYTAAPLFDGLSDPLPTRSGIRQGLEESVSLIIPPADAKNPEAPGRQGYEPGAGVEAYLATIGGPEGFRGPIKSAIASYIASYGSNADPEPLKAAIRAAITRAHPGGRSTDQLERYASDNHLDDIICWVKEHHGDRPPKGFVGEPPAYLDEAPPAAAEDLIPEREGWRASLIVNTKSGKPLAILANAITAFRHAPQWNHLLWYDVFHLRTVIRGTVPWPELPGDEWTSSHDVRAAEWLQRHAILVGPEIACQAVEAVAREQRFHPILDYLERCKWDGTPRLDTWAIDYLGAEDTSYVRAVSARWVISAVARVTEPGCKADCALILEGPQALLKSTALKILAQPWFADELADFGTKDAAVQLAGVWIIELGELDAISRSDVSRIKVFMSRTTDRFRPPYGRRAIEQPRQCIFAGSVNHGEYLRDETGGRRFWPIFCTRADLSGLAAARDQLWAEARHRYHAGEPWWLDTSELNDDAEEEQAARYQHDAWEEPIAEFIAGRSKVSVGEILSGVFHLAMNEWTQADQNRVARCLRLFKWRRTRISIAGNTKRRWVYVNPRRPRSW